MNLKRVSFSQGHGQEVAGTDHVDAGTRTGCGRCRTWGTAGNGDAVGTWAGCEAGVGHGVLQDMGCCRDKGRMWPEHGGVADQLAVVGYHFHGENCSLVA